MPENIEPANSSINWKLLLRRMERQKAVLFLGPEVPMAIGENPRPITEVLQEHIRRDLQDLLEEYDLHKIEYYNEDGFFHLEDEYRSDIVYPVIQFYRGLEVGELYRKLVQLPFHLILSLSPDELVCRAFEEQGLPYHFHFYNKRKYNKEQDDALLHFRPSPDNRLVYNVFGSVRDEGSLILSYDDLFEFLQKIFNNYHLPEAVRETVMDANYFLFIGFNYTKWYLKLLLRLFNLHEKVKQVYGTESPDRPETEIFFVNEFDMKFTRLHSQAFIEELYEKCREEGLLVQPPTLPRLDPQLAAELRRLIGQNEIERAFDLLLGKDGERTLPQPFGDQLVQLSARYHTLQRNHAKGILDYKDYSLELNRITDDLLKSLTEFS
ncbi:MAG: SIR2 family protein [Saprospiraceae bacterium]|nr:SIR2 family protein [Saprospiraceae bacterium]MCB0625040.1 SIR2 family protein [Saprospiraceae bacterium]MCB0678965.1 SIR2 family protein [Saprospiraceae bacterium]MCB0682480.1 SIR2 family protein [Saprospiraceae bacterium]